MRNHLSLLLFILLPLCGFSQSLEERPKVGLVLSGGGAKGFAHIGVIKVLEEAGIPIDYIAGASMGSIIGGLYAIGYHIDSIETLVKNQDWELLLSDSKVRKYLSFSEKEDDGKYMVSFPIKNGKILLPRGLIRGHHLGLLFNRLTVPVYDVRDFNQFPIPFTAVSTNIETGTSVSLTEGYLPEVLRASMAIPTVFTPVYLDSLLLVDGGLVDNFPVEAVKNMGADIIIGVDLQSPVLKKDEMNSLMDIMTQAGRFLREPHNERNRKMCDILIEPDLEDYSMGSFLEGDSIIAIGVKAASRNMDLIQKLADSLQKWNYSSERKLASFNKDSLLITEIEYQGRNKVSESLINGMLNFSEPVWVDLQQIEESVQRLYGSGYFNQVGYRLEEAMNGIKLVILLNEVEENRLDVGIKYNSYFNASILGQYTIRNLYDKGSRAEFTAELGKNNLLAIEYIVDKGWLFGFKGGLHFSNLEVFQYEDMQKTASYSFNRLWLDLGVRSNIRNKVRIDFGIQGEINSIDNRISPIDFDGIDNRYINYFAQIKFDTFDRSMYPKKGFLLNFDFKAITDDFVSLNEDNPAFWFYTRYHHAWQLTHDFSLINNIYGGISSGANVPAPYQFSAGGMLEKYIDGTFPLIGYDLMELTGRYALVYRLDLQYEIFRNHYLTLRGNTGNTNRHLDDIIKNYEELKYGYGLSYGIKSPVGPIELTLADSPEHEISFFLKLGVRF